MALHSPCAAVQSESMMWHHMAPQGYFHGEDWGARVGTPFCLVPSGSGNALAANCGLWTPQATASSLKTVP